MSARHGAQTSRASRESAIIQPPLIHLTALPSRRPIRLQGYDYSLPGDYFITICAHEMRCVFGRVEYGNVRLSSLGEMVLSAWREIPLHCDGVELDVFVVMPNHLHGIVRLTRSVDPGKLATVGNDGQPASLSTVIQRFKSFTATNYARGAAEGRWQSHGAKL